LREEKQGIIGVLLVYLLANTFLFLKMMEYPDKVILNVEKDNKNRIYLKAYSNKKTSCILSYHGTNKLFNGRLNLFLRKGNSKFGDEIGIYFKIADLKETYSTTSKHNVIECYLPAEFGINFLKKAINYFEKEIEK